MNDAFFKTAARPLAFGFAGAPLDRVSERREDADCLAALRERGPTRARRSIARDMPILPPGDGAADAALPARRVAALGGARFEALLGADADGAPVFAALLPTAPSRKSPTQRRLPRPPPADRSRPRRPRARSTCARSPCRAWSRRALAVLGQAKAILNWHARHGFCANCGAPTRIAAAGWRRECDACKAQHFPAPTRSSSCWRVDGERCLLGRQARFPKGMYSCLAGFLEPGETIEEAVRREIREEAGIACGEVAYVASQPWPFPSSLMIGCLARAASRDDRRRRASSSRTRAGLPRDEVVAMFERRHPEGLSAPAPMAIAHHIMRTWAEGSV